MCNYGAYSVSEKMCFDVLGEKAEKEGAERIQLKCSKGKELCPLFREREEELGCTYRHVN